MKIDRQIYPGSNGTRLFVQNFFLVLETSSVWYAEKANEKRTGFISYMMAINQQVSIQKKISVTKIVDSTLGIGPLSVVERATKGNQCNWDWVRPTFKIMFLQDYQQGSFHQSSFDSYLHRAIG